MGDPDGEVLFQLCQSGSNLGKPHPIEFFLYFPDQENANKAKVELIARGFHVEVNRSAAGFEWLCFVKKEMVPNHKALVSLRDTLNVLAGKYFGQYDGWGTPIAK